MAKQLWLHALADLDPARIVAGGRRAIGDSEYLPNLAALRRYCDPSPEELGMPDPRSAYIEACRAPSPKSAAAWSHPVVYHAGRASDWHLLSTAPEQIAFPVFKRNYELLVQRVRDGGDLQSPVPPALTERVDRELPLEERRRRLARLRSDLGL